MSMIKVLYLTHNENIKRNLIQKLELKITM